MVDLGPLLNLGGGLAASAIRSFGTEVAFTRETKGETDPITLETPTIVEALGNQKAILIKNGGGAGEVVGSIQVSVTDWRLILLPSAPDVDEDVHVTVTKCRDRALLGGRAKVLGGIREGAGVIYTVFARTGGKP